MRTTGWRLMLGLALATGLGLLDAELWQSDTTFWIANMSSGYLLLAFVAGALLRRARPAVALVAGASVVVVALAVFYASLVHAQHLDLITTKPAFVRYAVPGVVVGPAFAWLAQRWVRTRAWYAPAALALAMILEPVAWRQHLGFQPGSASAWHLETAVGALLALVVLADLVWRSTRDRSSSSAVG